MLKNQEGCTHKFNSTPKGIAKSTEHGNKTAAKKFKATKHELGG